jgi:hypothetical protein
MLPMIDLFKIWWYVKGKDIQWYLFLKDEAVEKHEQVSCKFSVFDCPFKVKTSSQLWNVNNIMLMQ